MLFFVYNDVMKQFILDDNVNYIIDKLHDNGHEAFVVGGCVRDMLMEKTPHDFDITTDALPQEVKSIFNDDVTIDTGIKHGTVTIVIDNDHYEVTTYRSDYNYLDHRHPTFVVYSADIEDDLKRRDFTINAMAYNHQKGIVDCFNGQQDLTDGIIRCVGVADKRFDEDALRIMRASRFAARFGFEIEEETASSIHKNKELLQCISIERINEEFSKLLLADHCDDILTKYQDVICQFIPEMSDYSTYQYKDAVSKLPDAAKTLELRLAIYLQSTSNYKEIVNRLRYSNKTIKSVCTLIEKGHDFIELDKVSIKKYLYNIGEEAFVDLLDYQKYNKVIDETAYEFYHSQLEKIIVNNECYSLKQLAINGSDLVELGYRNEEIGKKLTIVLKKVIVEQLPNDKQILIDYLTN